MSQIAICERRLFLESRSTNRISLLAGRLSPAAVGPEAGTRLDYVIFRFTGRNYPFHIGQSQKLTREYAMTQTGACGAGSETAFN
jgi:hypothetical protein